MTTEEKKTYTTTDFYTTAVLRLKKFPVTRIESTGPNNSVKRFHFEDTPELRKVVLDYMNGQLDGNLREFRNSIECIKDMIHSG